MGDMAEMMLLSHYDHDYFDSGYENIGRYSSYYDYDPTYFSRAAAKCDMCGTRYKDLARSVALTAKRARNAGWLIELNRYDGYEWYCPDCKAAHDFESAAREGGRHG